jgi:hypothetical protein
VSRAGEICGLPVRGHPRKDKKLHHSDDEGSDEADEESGDDDGGESGDADEFEIFESLVQEFTYHKGEKVRVWWESEGVWLIGKIDKVMAKSVEVYYEDLKCEPDFYARHNLRSSKIEKVVEK